MAQLLDYLSEKYQQETVDEVNRRLLELASLFEISQLINESLELTKVLNNVLLIPMGRLMLPRCAILLKLENEYRLVMSKGIPTNLKESAFSAESFPKDCFSAHKFDDPEKTKQLPADFRDFVAAANIKIGIPFICKNEPLGFLLFGAKLTRADFSDEEVDFLNSLANLAAPTIQNALHVEQIQTINSELEETNTKLAQKVGELNSLFDIARGLSSKLEKPAIVKLLMFELTGQMFISRYAVLDKTEDGLELYKRQGFKTELCEKLCREMAEMTPPESTCLANELSDSKIAGQLKENRVAVVIPMKNQDQLMGYILIGSKMSGQPFSDGDLEFMTTLVSQAVISLENARLFIEERKKQQLEDELNVARNIQKKLLPKSIPDVNGYDIYGMNDSSQQVGGDYFDAISIDDSRIALAIADVSGKGVPASLLMANLQAALRVMMTPELDLPKVVSKLNDLIYNNTGMDKFITFFIGILDFKAHTFQYVNAGHNNPVHFTADGEMNFLDIGGIILGVMPMRPYETTTISIAKDDVVVTYTDGVNEAIDVNEEEWGEEPMYDIIRNSHQKSVKTIVDEILDGIETFSAGAEQADDITMLVFKRLV